VEKQLLGSTDSHDKMFLKMGRGSMGTAVVFAIYVLVLSLPLWAQDLKQKLHVIVVEDETPWSKKPKSGVEVISLASGELPEVFSMMLVPSEETSPSVTLENLGFPPQSFFVDMFTFDIAAEMKLLKRSNSISGFGYELRVRGWHKEFFGIELKGEGLKKVSALAPKNVTTLIRVHNRKCHVFAFTPLDSTDLTKSYPGIDESIEAPVPVKQTVPKYPREFLFEGGQATCQLLCIIKKEGFVDPTRFIILRCPHPAYARNFWIPITYEWLFEAAKRDGKAVDMLASVEIEYRLR